MIDVDLRASVSDGSRRFELAARFSSDAPFVALYGPSGAGKSLTLAAIAGLLKPGQGHVRVAGRTLFDAKARIDLPARARRVGYLPQSYALFPHLTVRENVAFGLTSWRRRSLDREAAARVDSLLENFGLEAMAHSRPATLSGGQQQRTALARALASEPQILLLDEPFAALNPMLRQDLRRELAKVRERWNIPALMITHDIDDVLALADVAFMMDGGQIVREVNVRTAESHDIARVQLGGAADAASPLAQRVRGLLGG